MRGIPMKNLRRKTLTLVPIFLSATLRIYLRNISLPFKIIPDGIYFTMRIKTTSLGEHTLRYLMNEFLV